MYDKLRVYFDDDSTTILFVDEDTEIQDALAELEGDTGATVTGYVILEVIPDAAIAC